MNLDESQRALTALRRIVQALHVSSRASERAVGMSTAQLFVLRQIAAAGPCSIGELARLTLTHPSSVSVVVSRLVGRGLVERHDAEADRRRADVSCTAAGRALIEEGPVLVQDRLIAALGAMDAPALTALADGLDVLAASVARGADEPVKMFFDDDDADGARGPTGGRS